MWQMVLYHPNLVCMFLHHGGVDIPTCSVLFSKKGNVCFYKEIKTSCEVNAIPCLMHSTNAHFLTLQKIRGFLMCIKGNL